MITEFALDLRHARRKSGLSQEEVAYLVDISQSSYSRFEKGMLAPTTEQLCLLSLIYGRSFVSYFEAITRSLKPTLLQRLKKLPPKAKPRIRIFNRARTLEKLRQRITIEHGGA